MAQWTDGRVCVFASELVELYKTAIGDPLTIASPPCRTCLARTHLVHTHLLSPTQCSLVSPRVCSLPCVTVGAPTVQFWLNMKFNPSQAMMKQRKLYDGDIEHVKSSEEVRAPTAHPIISISTFHSPPRLVATLAGPPDVDVGRDVGRQPLQEGDAQVLPGREAPRGRGAREEAQGCA